MYLKIPAVLQDIFSLCHNLAYGPSLKIALHKKVLACMRT